MGRKLSLTERTLIFIASFVVIVYFLVASRIWQHDFIGYFLKAEKWPELIFVFVVAYGIKIVCTELLQWSFHVQSKRK